MSAGVAALSAQTDAIGTAAWLVDLGTQLGDQTFGARVGGLSQQFDGYARPEPIIRAGHEPWKDYGLDNSKVRWVTFEDAHIPEFKDPPGVERAADGKDMTKMLLEGELDAAIFGTVRPTDPRLKSVIPDPDAAAKEWYKKYGTVPINHMVVVKNTVVKSNPGAVREVFRMLKDSKQAAGLPKPGTIAM